MAHGGQLVARALRSARDLIRGPSTSRSQSQGPGAAELGLGLAGARMLPHLAKDGPFSSLYSTFLPWSAAFASLDSKLGGATVAESLFESQF